MSGHYNASLVALSVVIAIIASYTALDLAGRVTSATISRIRLAWLWGGSIVMGLGIWAMHYIGMAAFELPVPVLYDWPTVLLSLLAAMGAAWVALFFASQTNLSRRNLLIGSVAMGGGIAAMHYIGMEAMRLPAMCVYSPVLVSVAIVLAIVISQIALRFTFVLRTEPRVLGWSKAGSAVMMGLAIASMHYVGMASATFTPALLPASRLAHAVGVTGLGLTMIVVATVIFLLLALIASTIDRHATQQANELIRSRQQLKSVFDAVTEAIVIQDRDLNIVQINRAASRLLGLPESPSPYRMVETTFEVTTSDGALIAPQDWPSARALRGEFCEDMEVVVKNNLTGHRFFAELSTASVLPAPGDPPQIMTKIRDVTDHKLMDSERLLVSAIVESSEDAIVGKDLQGIVSTWNRGAEKIFGYTAQEMIGQSIRRLVPADRQAEEDDFLSRIVRGEVIDHVETVRQRKDGVMINVSVTISPIRNQWGHVVGASKIARDITDRNKLQRQLAQSQKMEAIGQLTGGVSHDFNNLLGIIIGNLDLLERIVDGNEAALQRLKTARKAANRGADLTRRLLAFSSTDELRPATTSLAHSLRNVMELAVSALGPTITIKADFDPHVKFVFVDPSSFETAILNLAVNARDAMPKGGTITISTRVADLTESYRTVISGDLSAGSYACISITDTGDGIPPDVLDRVFEPFYTTKPRGSGTGLGLAMVYGFVRQSGGTVNIYSEVGVGTTVSIYLPLTTSTIAADSLFDVVKCHTPSGGTVLVVDDEEELLEISSAYLTDMGYDPLTATDADSALKILSKRDDIVLMITDIIMPGALNGVELAKTAHELYPRLKIIYTSGFPAGALQERSLSSVDGPLLRKPYRISEFNAVVAEVMHSTG